MTDSDLNWRDDSNGRIKYKQFNSYISDSFQTNQSNSWYLRYVHDEVISVNEVSYDARIQLTIDSLLVYDVTSDYYPFPGQIITTIPVKKRWPSWEVSRIPNMKGMYDILYT